MIQVLDELVAVQQLADRLAGAERWRLLQSYGTPRPIFRPLLAWIGHRLVLMGCRLEGDDSACQTEIQPAAGAAH